MEVIFKHINNKSTTFKVELTDTFESIVPKLMEQNSIDPTKNNIRFIFKGKILNNTSTFSEFKDEIKLTIIYMVSKNKSEKVNANSSVPITQENQQQLPSVNQQQSPSVNQQQSPSVNQQQSPSVTSNHIQSSNYVQPSNYDSYDGLESNWQEEFSSGENPDDIDRFRASVICFLFFIRQSPQFSELFINNFQTLISALSSPQLRPLFEQIYNDTTELNNNDYMDNLTDHVSDIHNQTHIQTHNQTHNQTPTVSADGTSQQVMTAELNDNDQTNINTLVSLGFPKNSSIQAYIMCNKNLDLAASMLMDNQY